MCYENRLTGLDIRSCRNLQILECSHNQITELNTKSNRSLKKLNASFNCLTSLSLSSNKALSSLNVTHNERIIPCKSSFNLSRLPSFSVKKAKGWKGGKRKGKKLIPKKKKVTYTYNCGRGFKKKFTLVINRK